MPLTAARHQVEVVVFSGNPSSSFSSSKNNTVGSGEILLNNSNSAFLMDLLCYFFDSRKMCGWLVEIRVDLDCAVIERGLSNFDDFLVWSVAFPNWTSRQVLLYASAGKS